MRKIKSVFIKQLKSFFKNPAMFGTPVAFLLIPFAILLLIPGADTDRGIIIAQFVVMFVGISMIGTSSGFIAEDRATMNLRFMGMAGVKPYQYLLATCGALLLISLGILTLFGLMGMYSGETMMNFLIISMLGAACSMLLGITLSLSKAAPFTMLVGMLLGIGPIFADANEVLESIFRFTYTHQVNTVIRGDLSTDLDDALTVVLINIAVLLLAFIVMNAKNGLDGEKLTKETRAC